MQTIAVPQSSPGKTKDVSLLKEKLEFKRLQQGFASQYESVFPDRKAAKTVIIIPSLSLDTQILEKISGVIHYEERLLCLLMLLRMPQTHVIYITSLPIDPVIIDYYLHLLPGITGYHARQRLTMLSCFDTSSKSLIEKILERPRLIERIKKTIPAGHIAHLACFNVTPAERKLAVQLNLPIYGCDPDLEILGNKSNGRKIFKDCGICTPNGYEDIFNEDEIIMSLYKLKRANPQLLKAVLKINEGFSGEGNAVFYYDGAPIAELLNWLKKHFSKQLKIVASDLSFEVFLQKFEQYGGIVEEFIEGHPKKSPSVQCRINPLGRIEIISTHDQLLGGESGQVFIGATFPANKEYAREIGEMGRMISEQLKKYGVIGRYSIDFISVKHGDEWKNYAIEINLRKGGTTHPYLMLQFLTDGAYNSEDGEYFTASGQKRYYFCSDNLESDQYKGLTPYDLIDVAMFNDLLYDGSNQEGVMFHLISALSQYGKLGVVCIGKSMERAHYFYRKTVEVLDRAQQEMH